MFNSVKDMVYSAALIAGMQNAIGDSLSRMVHGDGKSINCGFERTPKIVRQI